MCNTSDRRRWTSGVGFPVCALLAVWLVGGGICAAEVRPDEGNSVSGPILTGVVDRETGPGPDRASIRSTAAANEITTRFRIPLRAPDWKVWAAYVDLDETTGVLDFECLSETYDTHTGNDLGILDFVEQAEGRFVVAAAPGTVSAAQDGYFDQQTDAPSEPSNVVFVTHEDGSESRYWHLKKWSVMVHHGQQVFEGQPLGLVGSSGESSGAHLHFSVMKDGVMHEPHAGPCRAGDSLWQDQQEHMVYRSVDLAYAGMSSVDPLVDGQYKFRPPDVHHYTQTPSTKHYFWYRLRYLHPGDVSRIIITDPSDAVYRDFSYEHTYLAGLTTWRLITTLPASGSLGTWTVELHLNGVPQVEKTFTYDTLPNQVPEAQGRTLAVLHGTAGDVLHGSDPDGGLKEFRIAAQPAHGRVVLRGPRQSYFQYTPDSGFQGQDSFRFEVEDAEGLASAAERMLLDVAPVVANVLRLEGEDDHVAVPDDGSLNVVSAFTLEAWVRRTVGSSVWQFLIDRRNPDNLTGYSLAIQPDSTLRLQVGTGTTSVLAYGTTAVPMNRWTHVAGTWNGQELRVYLDGVLDSAPVGFTGPISYPGTYETWLGRSRQAGNSFRGEIDEIRIWSTARSADELRAGASCALLAAPPPAALRGWWRMQGDSSDSSAQANHGAVVGVATFRRSEAALPFCSSEDSDGDGHADDADNCPLASNPDQSDADADGLGDACDLCPAVISDSRADFDRDGVGDACDLCPFLADTEQLDSDSDGSGDLCDPEPWSDSVGVPTGAIELDLVRDPGTGLTTLSWSDDPMAAEYQVTRGTPEEIRARFYGSCVSFDDPDPSDTSFEDGTDPVSGDWSGYLVVGIGASGARGPAGLDSEGSQRDLRAKDCTE